MNEGLFAINGKIVGINSSVKTYNDCRYHYGIILDNQLPIIRYNINSTSDFSNSIDSNIK